MCLLKCMTGLVPENPLAVNVLMVMKNIFDGWFKLKAPDVLLPMLLSHRLHGPLFIVSFKGYIVLINHAHLMLLILKQHLLCICRFTIKQAGLVVIKQKAFRKHTLFYTFAALFLTSLSSFPYAYIFALKATNSVMIFPPSSSFIRPMTFLFLLIGSRLFSSFEYPLHIFCNVSIKIFCLYLINKAVSIHIAQCNLVATLRSHVVIMKLIH